MFLERMFCADDLKPTKKIIASINNNLFAPGFILFAYFKIS